MSSVEEIVRNIIDTLSDSVAELVLMVVVLAEQNSPMPPHLPQSSSSINATADKLAKIAKQLAKQDYAAFPSIANEITEAATAVEGATGVLSSAIQSFETNGNRKQAWEGLVSACRVMSGKTIRLLHIIYGAPLQRLFLNADNLTNQIAQFDPKPKGLDNLQNQQKVIDNLKPITDGALRMQKHLNDRAKNTDDPTVKAELEKQAKAIRDKAEALVNAVNQGLADPSKADFTKPLQDLSDAVQEGRNLAQESAPPAPPSMQRLAPSNLDDAIAKAVQAAKQIPKVVKENPKNFAPVNDELKDAVNDVRKRATPGPDKKHDWTKDIEKPLAEQYKAAREALKNPSNPQAKQALDKATDDVVKALEDLNKPAGAGDYAKKQRHKPDSLEEAVRIAQDAARDIPKAVQQNPNNLPAANNELKDSLNDVQGFIEPDTVKSVDVDTPIAELKNAAQEVARNPNNPAAKQALDNAANNVVKALDDAKKSPPSGSGSPQNLPNAVEAAKAAAREVAKTAHGNPRNLPNAMDKLDNAIGDVNNAEPNPTKPLDWNKDIGAPVADQSKAAQDALRNPAAKPALQKATDGVVKALEDLLGKPRSAGSRANNARDNKPKDLAEAVKIAKDAAREIPKVAEQNPNHLPSQSDKLADALNDVHQFVEPNTRKPVNLGKEIDAPVKAQQNAARAFAHNPNNPAAKQALDKATDDLVKALDELKKTTPGGPTGPHAKGPQMDNAIENAKAAARDVPNVARNNPKELPVAEDRLKDTVEDVKQQTGPNPTKDFDWDKDVEKPVADQKSTAQSVAKNPNNPVMKQDLDKATGDVLKALDSLLPDADRHRPQSLEEAVRIAQDAAREIPPTAHQNPEALPEAKDTLNDALDDVRGFLPPNIKIPVDVDTPLAEQKKAAQDVAQKPTNPAATQALNKATNDVLKALDDIKASPDAPKPLKDAIERAKAAARDVPKVARENPNSLPAANDKLKDAIRAVKGIEPNPTKPVDWNKDIGEPVAEQDKAAQDAARNPHSPTAKPALAKATNDVVKALEDLLGKPGRGDNDNKPKSLEEAVRIAKEAARDIPPTVHSNPDDLPVANDELEKALDDVKSFLPPGATKPIDVDTPAAEQKRAAENVAKNPQSPSAKQELNKATNDVLKALDDMKCAPGGSTPKNLDDAIEKAKDAARDVLQAARENPTNVGPAADKLSEAIDAIKQIEPNPSKPLDWNKDIGEPVAEQARAADDAARNPENPSTEPALQKATDDVVKALDSLLPNSTAPGSKKDRRRPNNLEEAVQMAKDAARDVPRTVQNNPHKLPEANDALGDALDDVRSFLPPNAIIPVNVDTPVAEQQKAAAQAAKNPNNPAVKKDLNKATNDVLKALDDMKKGTPDKRASPELADAVERAKYAARDVPKVANENPNNLVPATNKLKDAVNAAKRIEPSPTKRVDWNEDIATPAAEQQQAAEDAVSRPRDPTTAPALDKATDDLVKALDNLLAKPTSTNKRKPNSLEEAVQIAKDAARDIPPTVSHNPNNLPTANNDLRDAIDDVKGFVPSDAVKPIDLDKPLEDQKKAAQEVAKNPNNAVAKQALAKATDDALKALDDVKKNSPGGLQGPKKLADAVERAKDAVKAVPAAVQSNPNNLVPATDKAKDAVNAVNRIEPNPIKPLDWNKDIEAPVTDQNNAAKDAVKNPSNPASKPALDRATDDVVKALDDLLPKSKSGPGNARPKNLEEAIKIAKAAARDIPPTVEVNPEGLPTADKNLDDALDDVQAFLPPDATKHIDLDTPLDEQKKAAEDVARNPNNPDAKKALDKATDDVLKALDDVKNAPPSPGTSPQALKDAVEKAKEAARDVPKSAREKPKYVGPASEKLGDAVNAVRRIEPNPKKPVDWNKDIGVPVVQLKKTAQDAAKNPGNSGTFNRPALRKATDDVVKALDDLLPKPHNLRPSDRSAGPEAKNYDDARRPNAANVPPGGAKNKASQPGDSPYGKPPTEEQAKEIADKANKIAKPLVAAITKPEDKEKLAHDKIKDALKNAREAADNGKIKPAQAHAKHAVDAAQDLARQLRDRANNPNNALNDDDRAELRQAADDLDKIAPSVLDKARALKDNNPASVKDFKDQAAKLERAADRAVKDPNNARPLSPKEQEKLKEHLNNAVAAAKRGDRAAYKKHIDAAEPLVQRARNFVIKKGSGVIPPQGEFGPSAELQRLWKKFLGTNDPVHMKKAVDEMDGAIKKIDQENNGSPLAAANALDDAINNVQAAVDSGNAKQLPIVAKALQDKYNDFVNENKKNPNPAVQNASSKAATAMLPQVQDLIKKSVDAMQNPNDQKKVAAVGNTIPQIRKNLADFKKAVGKDPDVDNGADVKDAQAKVNEALAKGDPEGVQKSVGNLKKALGQYNDHAKKLVDNTPNTTKQPLLAAKVAKLDDAAKKLNAIDKSTPPSQVEKLVDSIPALVDDFEDEMRSDAKDDSIKAAAKATNLAAFMNDVDENDMDLGDLLTTAGELTGLMRGLVGGTTAAAQELGASDQPLTSAAESALELGGLFDSLGGGWANPNASSSSDDILGSLSGGWADPSSSSKPSAASTKMRERMDRIQPASSNPFEHAPSVTLANARSFEDITSAVAYNIHKKSKEMQQVPSSATGQNVALELANIAAATRSGNKHQLLLSAKAASGQLQAFAKELEELANKIPGKTPREKEIQSQFRRAAMGLKNYGMHLKILASVKASSSAGSSGDETDISLGTIVTDLGDVISTSLSTIHTAYTTLRF